MVNKFTASIGDGESTEFTINHGLKTMDVIVDVYHTLSGASENALINRKDENTVTIKMVVPKKQGIYRVVIIG